MRSSCVAVTVVGTVLAIARTSSAQDAGACIAAFEDGQRLATAGKLLAAREKLDMCGLPRCPAVVRADCLHKREELERAIPTIAVILRDVEGRDVEARFALDGHPFAAQPGRAVPVDPGKHSLVYTRPGRAAREHRFIATEGEKSRLVAITSLGDEPLETAPVAPAPSGPAVVEPAETSQAATPSRAGPWIVIATGGVMFVAGGILSAVGVGELGDAQDIKEENDRLPKDASDAQFNALDADYTATRRAGKRDIAIGVTGMAAGAAVVALGFIWRAYGAKRQARIAPVVTPSFGGLSLAGTF